MEVQPGGKCSLQWLGIQEYTHRNLSGTATIAHANATYVCMLWGGFCISRWTHSAIAHSPFKQPSGTAHTDLRSCLCTDLFHLMAPKAEKQPAKKSVSKVGGAKSSRKKGSRKAIESYKIYIYKVKCRHDLSLFTTLF